MSSYGYEREPPRTYVREERREERVDPRYADSRAEYTRTYSRDLVPRARESSDLSIEEVRREFPPPQARDIRRTRSAEPNYYDDDDDYYDYRRDHDRRSKKTSTTMSVYREERHAPKHRSMSKQEKIIAAVAGAALLAGGKELYDRREAQQEGSSEIHRNPLASVALAGIGALAAYQGAEYYNKVQARKDQKAVAILNRGGYDSDDDMSTKEKKGQKNFLESAIAATGLGAAVKSLTGKGDGDKTRGGEPRSGGNKMQKAAMASLLAGATEAFRVAKEPGGWKGEKTRRILTAAAGAATIDSAQNKDHGKIGLAESVIGGLVGNRLINGSKNDIEEDKKTGRSRSRSRARSSSRDGGSGGTGLAALASAGLGAFGAKAAYDTYQNRSRSRAGSDDSRGRGDSPDRRRSRSRSVVDKARNSLAKLGIGNGTDDDRRHTQDDFDDRGSRRSQRRYSDEYDDDYRSNRGRDYYDDRDRSYRSRHGGDHHYDSDLGDSDEDEKKHKKMRGKSMLMSGLAAVATIHAAHSIYKGVEKREARQVAVREGKMSTEDAAKLRNKALLQDAASVGLAALGIKGAISEFKEAKELTHECHEFKKQKAERHQKRIEARKQRTAPSTRQQSPNNWSSGQQHQYPESDEEDYYYHEVARTYEHPQRANTLPPRAY